MKTTVSHVVFLQQRHRPALKETTLTKAFNVLTPTETQRGTEGAFLLLTFFMLQRSLQNYSCFINLYLRLH